ncbi:unnamed protein product [Lasius platythorax]|uniref:Uncharacterized protein n=1 Tax=Lasius platythorax TaxID=488582 RepID=A0AAV2MZY6_9HYME
MQRGVEGCKLVECWPACYTHDLVVRFAEPAESSCVIIRGPGFSVSRAASNCELVTPDVQVIWSALSFQSGPIVNTYRSCSGHWRHRNVHSNMMNYFRSKMPKACDTSHPVNLAGEFWKLLGHSQIGEWRRYYLAATVRPGLRGQSVLSFSQGQSRKLAVVRATCANAIVSAESA